MKYLTLTSLVLLFLASAADAQKPGHGMHPGFGSEEAFELILTYTDNDTATALTDLRNEVQETRDELQALLDADEVDEAAVDALRDELRALRDDLASQVRAIVEANDDLRAELRTLAREAHQERIVGGYILHDSETFDEIVSTYATAEQAAALTENDDRIEALRAEIQAARDAGATRADLHDLFAELRALRDEQRDIVADILDANSELVDSMLEEARSAREETRDRIRDRGMPGRRPGRGG